MFCPYERFCPPGTFSYNIRTNDTLYKIAEKFQTTAAAIISANPGINLERLEADQLICIPERKKHPRPWLTYTNTAYNITFMYPSRWSRIDDERCEGIDGFFHIIAAASDSDLDAVCNHEAYHKLKPYGTKPVISHLSDKHHKACLILPSDDQPMAMHEQSALVLECPEEIVINGSTCNFLILRADKKHIKDIIGTLKMQ